MSESECVVIYWDEVRQVETQSATSSSRQAAIIQAFALWRQHKEVRRIECGGGEVIEGEELNELIRKQSKN